MAAGHRSILAAVCLAIAVISPALAGSHDSEWNPPARFDHPYALKMVVKRVSPSQVVQTCRKLYNQYSVGEGTIGCSTFDENAACIIVIPNKRVGFASPEAVLRHEIGHCNGWPAHHPG